LRRRTHQGSGNIIGAVSSKAASASTIKAVVCRRAKRVALRCTARIILARVWAWALLGDHVNLPIAVAFANEANESNGVSKTLLIGFALQTVDAIIHARSRWYIQNKADLANTRSLRVRIVAYV
jgi:hypothetical protein